MTYIIVFIATFVGLIYFIGIDFNFEEPEVVLEGREGFFEIRTTLEQIEATYDFAEFRAFTLIPLFDGVPGRTNLFSLDGMDAVRVAETEEMITE